MIKTFWAGFGRQRAITHVVLAALTLAGIYATTLYSPYGGAVYIFTIGFGYISVVFLCVTLLIGPLNMMRKRFNGVNIDLRRDTGIWAGITGCLHVVSAIILDNRGSILAFFIRFNGLQRFDIGIVSNDVGLVATILLVLLLVLSNHFSLRKLKGKRWKQIQRLNYVLMALVFLHTFIYQRLGGRPRTFIDVTVIAVFALISIQVIGFSTYQKRKAEQLRR